MQKQWLVDTVYILDIDTFKRRHAVHLIVLIQVATCTWNKLKLKGEHNISCKYVLE